MNKKTSIVALIVVAIIAISGTFLPQGKTVVQTVTEKLGAVSTLDGVDNPFVNIGGSKFYYYNNSMTATSSTVCSFKNPLQATSTLVRASAKVTSNGLGAQTLDISTSTAAFASSSPSYVKNFAAGAGQFTVVWEPGTTTSSTLIGLSVANTGYSDNIIGPNDYITWRIATGTAGTFAGGYWTGSCNALLMQI